MSGCRIQRNKDSKQIENVYTKSGARSMLFERLASLPFVNNLEDAFDAYRSFFSDSYKKKHGDWEKSTPVNDKAASTVRKSAKRNSPDLYDKIMSYANEMEDPMLLYKNELYQVDGYDSYSEEPSTDSTPYLVERQQMRDVVMPNTDSSDAADMLSDNMGDSSETMVNVISAGSSTFLISTGYSVLDMSKMPDDTVASSTLIDEHGEPRLFYKGSNGMIYDTYKEALKNSYNGLMEIGSLSGTVSKRGSAGINTDIVINEDGSISLNNDDSFNAVMNAPVDNDLSKRSGIINSLICKGWLSDHKERSMDGTYHLTGAGLNTGYKNYNSIVAFDILSSRLGRDVTIDDDGHIDIQDRQEGVVKGIDRNGKEVDIDESDILDSLNAGRYYEDIDGTYQNGAVLAYNVLLNNGDIYEDSIVSSTSDEYKEIDANIKTRIIESLNRLGFDLLKVSEFVETYKSKYGEDITSYKLSSILNEIIDVSGSTLSQTDISDEAADLIAGSFISDDRIEELRQPIMNAEWYIQNSSNARLLLKNIVESDYLDTAVLRHALCKEAKEEESFAQEELSQAVDDIRFMVTPDESEEARSIHADASMISDESNDIKKENSTDNALKFSVEARDMANSLENSASKISQQSKKLDNMLNQGLTQHKNQFILDVKGLPNISLIEKNMDSIQLVNTANHLIAMAEAEADVMERKVLSMKNGTTDKLKGGPELKARLDAMKIVIDGISSLKSVLRENTEIPDSTRKKMIDRIRKATEQMMDVQGDLDNIIDSNNGEALESLMDKYGFREEEKKEFRAEHNKVQDDISLLTRYFGLLRDSSSYILKMLTRMISANNFKARNDTMAQLVDFVKTGVQYGWTRANNEALLQRNADGSLSSFLRSDRDFARYSDDLMRAQVDALMESTKELNPDEYNEYIKDKDSFYKKARTKGVYLRVRSRFVNTKGLSADNVESLIESLRDYNQEEYDKYLKDKQAYLANAISNGVDLETRDATMDGGLSDADERYQTTINGMAQTLTRKKSVMKDTYRTFRPNMNGLNVGALSYEQSSEYQKRMKTFYDTHDERYWTDDYYQKQEEIEEHFKNDFQIHAVMDVLRGIPGNEANVQYYIKNRDAFMAAIRGGVVNGQSYNGGTFNIAIGNNTYPLLDATGEIIKGAGSAWEMLTENDRNIINSNIDKMGTVMEEIAIIRKNRSMNRRVSQKKYYVNGKLDYASFMASKDYNDFMIGEKSYRERMSDFTDDGLFKTGIDGLISRGLRQMQGEWSSFYKQRREDALLQSGGSQTLDSEFMKQLEAIERNQGNEAAFDFLMSSGRISFTDDYWSSLTSTNGYDDKVDDLISNYAQRLQALGARDSRDYVSELRSHMDRLSKLRNIVKKKIGINKDTSRPGEIEDTINELDKQTIKDAQVEIEDTQKSIQTILNEFMAFDNANGGTYNASVTYTGDSEITFNDYFIHSLLDYTKQSSLDKVPLDAFDAFIEKHMTKRKYNLYKNFEHLVNILAGSGSMSRTISAYDEQMLTELFGVTNASDQSDLFSQIRQMTRNDPSLRDSVMKKYAQRIVLPYCKKSSPKGYNNLLSLIKSNSRTFSVSQFVRDKNMGEKGTNSQQSVDNDLYDHLSLQGGYSWYQDQRVIDGLKNANYQENSDYGRHQPKISGPDSYLDTEYMSYFGIRNGVATAHKDEWDMIQTYKEQKRKIVENYGMENEDNLYYIPQVSKSEIERVNGLVRSPLDIAKNYIADKAMERVDDPLYGQSMGESLYESGARQVPKYYVHSLENEDDVSHDLGYSFAIMTLASNQYKQKMANMNDYLSLKQMMMDAQFNGGKSSSDTNAYQMMKEAMDYNLYGVKMSKKIIMNLGGYKIDMTKIIMGFERFVERMNLMFSPIVGLKGLTSSINNHAFETFVGQHMNKSSWAYAMSEVARMTGDYVGEIGRVDRTNKLYVLGEAFGIYDIRERTKGAGYNRLWRVFKNMGYKINELGETGLDAVAMIEAMDNYRLYEGDGPRKNEFITYNEWNELKKRDPQVAEWESMKGKSLYNMIDVIDGKVVPKAGLSSDEIDIVNKGMIQANAKIKFLVENFNGMLNEEDQVAARRHWGLTYLMAHRGWAILAGGRFLKKRGINPDTGMIEEGYVRSYLGLLKKTGNILLSGNIANIRDAYNGMTQNEKIDFDNLDRIACKRLLVHAGFMAVFAILVRAMLGWDDKDKEERQGALAYMQEVAMFLTEGTENEFLSTNTAYGLFGNVVEMLDQPIVASRTLSNVADVTNWLPPFSMEKVKSGDYKDDTNLERFIYRNTFIRHFRNFSSAENIRRTRKSWEGYNVKSTPFIFKKKKKKKSEDYTLPNK